MNWSLTCVFCDILIHWSTIFCISRSTKSCIEIYFSNLMKNTYTCHIIVLQCKVIGKMSFNAMHVTEFFFGVQRRQIFYCWMTSVVNCSVKYCTRIFIDVFDGGTVGNQVFHDFDNYFVGWTW